MVKNVNSRVFHGTMLGICLFLCLMAIISLGCFASEHDKIRRSLRKDYPNSDDQHYCILFTDPSGEDKILLSDGKTCVLAIWGETAISLVALLLGALFLIKAMTGLKAISFFLLVELVILVLTGLFALSVAIVISAGLGYTCKTFTERKKHTSCSGAKIGFEHSDNVSFYGNIHAAEVTAWIAFLVLAGMCVIYLFGLCVYIYRRRHSAEVRRTDEMYDHLTSVAEEEPTAV